VRPLEEILKGTEPKNLSLEEILTPPAPREKPLVAGVAKGVDDPLWLKAIRVPGKPADALNAWFRRLTDEGIEAAKRNELPDLSSFGEAWGAAWRAFTDLNRDVPPTAVRAFFGLKAGQSSRGAYNAGAVADYILGGILDPSNFLAGPALKIAKKVPGISQGVAAVERGQARAGAAVQAGLEKAAGTKVGSAISRAAAATANVGPTAAMMREIRRRYETPLAYRMQQAGQIVREMVAWQRAHSATNPRFRAVLDGYRKGLWKTAGGGPGVDPLTDLVRLYVQTAANKGTKTPWPPKHSAAHLAIIQQEAQLRDVPFDVVREYGDRLLKHGEGTLAILRAGGGEPFVHARGVQFSKNLPPKGDLRLARFAGVYKDAKERSEARLRRRYFNDYVNSVLARAPQVATGEVGAAAFSGSGLTQARAAGIRLLAADLLKEGRYVRPAPLGTPVPAGWVKIPEDVRDLRNLRGTMMPATLWNYLRGEIAQSEKVFTRLGKVTGPPVHPVAQVAEATYRAIGQVTGVAKKAWISSLATSGANTVGNHILSELALRRAGVGLSRFHLLLPTAFNQVRRFAKTGEMSDEILEFSRYSRAFLETEVMNAGVRASGKKGSAALSGRVIAPTGGRGVYVPPPGETAGKAVGYLADIHGMSEQAYKLALYLSLKPKMGAEAAARHVEKHLFDYSDRGVLLQAADQFGLWVFNAFPTKALSLYLDTIVKRPDLAARYPRLSRLIRGEFGKTEEDEKTLPAHRQHASSLPVSRSENLWADFTRFNPFAGPMNLIPTPGREGQAPMSFGDRLSLLPGYTAAAPIISQIENRRLYSPSSDPDRIVPEGTPPDREWGYRWRELVRSALPIVRGVERARAGAQGVTQYPGKTSAPQAPLESLLQGVGGLPTFRGETRDERDERNEALVESRGEVFDRVMDAIEAIHTGVDVSLVRDPEVRSLIEQFAGKVPVGTNPYRDRVAKVTDLNWLLSEKDKAARALKGSGAMTIGRDGRIVDPDTLIAQYLWLSALGDRLDEME